MRKGVLSLLIQSNGTSVPGRGLRGLRVAVGFVSGYLRVGVLVLCWCIKCRAGRVLCAGCAGCAVGAVGALLVIHGTGSVSDLQSVAGLCCSSLCVTLAEEATPWIRA
jgi:hypothetical protein